MTATPRASTSNASAHQSASGDDDGESESEPFSVDEWKQWMQISIGDDDDSDASLSDELPEIGTDEVALM